MIRLLRLALSLTILSTSGVAFAAGTTPAGYQPDPELRTESRSALEARVRRGCTATQARLQSVSETALSGPCNCYASRTMRALNAAEIQSFRDTGYFNDTARAKALATIDACRLQRPA